MNSALTLDIPLARKVLEHLLAHPEEHDQSYFGVQKSCGTTACIAGTAILMDSQSKVAWEPCSQGIQMQCVAIDGEFVSIDDRAAELLGLSLVDSTRLFYTYDNGAALRILASYIEQAETEQGS